MPPWIPYLLASAAYVLLVTVDGGWSPPITEKEVATDETTGATVTKTWVTYKHQWTYKRINRCRVAAIALFVAGTICACIPS